MTDIAVEALDTRELQQRLEFESLILALSSRFINLRPSEVGREIEDALRRVCEALDLDIAVLWQWSVSNTDVIAPTHVYRAFEGQRASGPLRQDLYPWTRDQMLAGRLVFIPTLEGFPPEAAVDRKTCESVGIKSAISLPLMVGGSAPIGALGLNSVRSPRDWPDALVRSLQMMTEIFTNALARERYEDRLLQSEARLAASADLAGLAFYEVDFDEGVAHADERLRDLCGFPSDQADGLAALAFWMRQIHPADRERILEVRRKMHAGTLDSVSEEYRIQHPTRGERWVHHIGRVASRDIDRQSHRSFGVLRDITDAKQSETALRDLSRRLIKAHEDERALLARDLHDDLTQRLAVLAIDVGRVELAASESWQAEIMRSVRTELVRLSEDVHALAYQLHPSVLDELGLIEALRAECQRRNRLGRIAVAMEFEPLPSPVAKDAQLCLFRVAQEALANVTRHAGINAAKIMLRPTDGGLLLAVSDQGVGFDPACSRAGRSLGLASMRERVNLVNGTLDIESSPGRGTTVVAWVPAQPAEGLAA